MSIDQEFTLIVSPSQKVDKEFTLIPSPSQKDEPMNMNMNMEDDKLTDTKKIELLKSFYEQWDLNPPNTYYGSELEDSYDLLIRKIPPSPKKLFEYGYGKNFSMLRRCGTYYNIVDQRPDLYVEIQKYLLLHDANYYTSAIHNLGKHYEKIKDYPSKVKYYLMGVDKGNILCVNELAYHYLKVEVNPPLAKKYLYMSLDMGQFPYILIDYHRDHEREYKQIKHLIELTKTIYQSLQQKYVEDLKDLLNQCPRFPMDVKVEPNDPPYLICLVCKQNRRNLQIQPCGHVATCHQCLQNLIDNDYDCVKCPLCQGSITDLYTLKFA